MSFIITEYPDIYLAPDFNCPNCGREYWIEWLRRELLHTSNSTTVYYICHCGADIEVKSVGSAEFNTEVIAIYEFKPDQD